MAVGLQRYVENPKKTIDKMNVSARPVSGRLSPVQTPTISPFAGAGELGRVIQGNVSSAVARVEDRIALAKKNSKLTELSTNFTQDKTVLQKEIEQLGYEPNGEQNSKIAIKELEERYKKQIGDDEEIYNIFWPSFIENTEKMKVGVEKTYREKFIKHDQNLMKGQVDVLVGIAGQGSYSECLQAIEQGNSVIDVRFENGIIDENTKKNSKTSLYARSVNAYFESQIDANPIQALDALQRKGDKESFEVLGPNGKVVETVETEAEAEELTKKLNTISEQEEKKHYKSARGKERKGSKQDQEKRDKKEAAEIESEMTGQTAKSKYTKEELVGDGLGHTYRDANYKLFDKMLPEQRQEWIKKLEPKAKQKKGKMWLQRITSNIQGAKEQKKQLNLVPEDVRGIVKEGIELRQKEQERLLKETNRELADKLTSALVAHKKNGGSITGAMDIALSADDEVLQSALKAVVKNMFDTSGKGKKKTNLIRLAEVREKIEDKIEKGEEYTEGEMTRLAGNDITNSDITSKVWNYQKALLKEKNNAMTKSVMSGLKLAYNNQEFGDVKKEKQDAEKELNKLQDIALQFKEENPKGDLGKFMETQVKITKQKAIAKDMNSIWNWAFGTPYKELKKDVAEGDKNIIDAYIIGIYKKDPRALTPEMKKQIKLSEHFNQFETDFYELDQEGLEQKYRLKMMRDKNTQVATGDMF